MPLLTALRVVRIAGTSQEYELTAPLVYQGHTDTWTIPVGFRTDLASVPSWAQWLIPHNGPYAPAAVVHDWLYIERPPSLGTDGWVPITRKDADGVLLRIMRELKVAWWKRTLIYNAVRVGGWWYWYKCATRR